MLAGMAEEIPITTCTPASWDRYIESGPSSGIATLRCGRACR